MIISTKSADSLLKGIVPKNNLMISKIESIAKDVLLDPAITQPHKELFIVTNNDFKNPRVASTVLNDISNKHPKVVIMYIDRSGRGQKGVDENLFDIVLSKPSKDKVYDTLTKWAQSVEARKQFQTEDEIKSIESYKMEQPAYEPASSSEPDEAAIPESVVFEYSEPDEAAIPDSETITGDSEIDLIRRLKETENWVSITGLAKEINATQLIKEVANANMFYKQSEDAIVASYESIRAIMCNPEYSIVEKLTKVHSIQCDKSVLKSKANNVLAQTVDEIISIIVDKSKASILEMVETYNRQLNAALVARQVNGADNVRLSTIIEDRAKLVLELQALDLELKGVAATCDKLVTDISEDMVNNGKVTTDMKLLDSRLDARYGTIVPEGLLDVLEKMFILGKFANGEFGELSVLVNTVIRKMYSLLSLYQDEIEVLGETIRFLKANHVEDTVIANTIMKKTCRLYITDDKFTSTTLAYMISRYKSREVNNVLLIDTTGSDMFEMFGIKTITFGQFMNNDYMSDKFLIVSTYGDNSVDLSTIENCERLQTRMLHYAKHYSMINIIADSNAKQMLEFYRREVISINYMVDCFPHSIERMKECIKETDVENTATRIIVYNNNYNNTAICQSLDVIDRLDVQLVTVPPIEELRVAALRRADPFEVDSIQATMAGVYTVC